MDKNILEIAAKAMKVSIQDAQEHYKELPEINAYYFWNPIRGGISVIVSFDGEKLSASSAVSFDRHLEEYKKGRRN